MSAYDYEALPDPGELSASQVARVDRELRSHSWLERIARRVADQQVQVDVDNMSWWDTEEGILVQEAWDNLQRHEKSGDVQRFSTSLLIMARLCKKMHDMVEKEAREVSRRKKDEKDRESAPPASHVRTKDKVRSPESLDETMAA